MGGLAINSIPISQFPSVAPPSVVVSVSYRGASAEILVDSVLVILEQAINGVQDMRYMIGDATSAGEGTNLGDFRSTLIPTLAVPVSLIGTFFFMLIFGMSINLITLFALVLAIGVVVDDAIVAVEAVY